MALPPVMPYAWTAFLLTVFSVRLAVSLHSDPSVNTFHSATSRPDTASPRAEPAHSLGVEGCHDLVK